MRRPFPILTPVTLALTAGVTATRLLGDGVLDALRRDPGGLEHGQIWRLLSPVLVQSDPHVRDVISVLVVCLPIGVLGERVFTRRQWIALYLVGALAGHSLGEWFQPRQGGTSVAFAGVLGGLAAYVLLTRSPLVARLRPAALLAIPLALYDTWRQDIHGLPYLAGLALAACWLLRDPARGGHGCHISQAPVVR